MPSFGKDKIKNKLIDRIIKIWPFLFIFSIWFFFASPFFIKNLAPFPADYLVNFFSPWSSYPQFSGPIKNAAQPDVITQIYPWKKFTIDILKSGQIPLWNPYSFSGTPHLANYQSAVLTPFNLLFFIFDFVDAWSLLILFCPLLGGCLMYFFLRSLGRSKLGSLIASVSFMFCGFITAWLSYGTLSYAIVFLPLSLFAIEKFHQSKKSIYLVLLPLSILLSFFSGHFQISLYFLIITLGYSVYKFLISRNIYEFLAVFFSILTGIILSAPQLLPSIEAYTQAVRSSIFQKSEIIPWTYLPTLIAPDFFGNPVTRNDWLGHYAEWNAYIGLVPLILAVYSVWFKKKLNILFWLISGMIAFLFAFDTPLIDFLVKSHLPVLSTSAASRIIVIFSFCFSVLSSFGFDQLTEDVRAENRKRIISIAVLILLILSFLWTIVFFKLYIPPEKIITSRQNLILPTIIVFAFFISSIYAFIAKNKKIFLAFSVITLVLVTFDLLRFATKWQSFGPKHLIFPEFYTTSEFEKISGVERVIGAIGQEASVYYRLPSLVGYDAIYQNRYGEFIASLKDGKLNNSPRSVVLFPNDGKYSQKAINLLGVKYVIHKVSDTGKPWAFPVWSFTDKDFQLIYDDKVIQIFQNKNYLPRAFIVGDYEVARNKQSAFDRLFAGDFDLSKKIILEENPEVLKFSSVSAQTNIEKYTANEIAINYSSDRAGLLFLSDTYSDGWKAYIEGEESKIYRANFAFRAIKVPEGKHRVYFRYEPRSFILGVYASIVGFSAFLVGLLFFKKIKLFG